MRFYTEEQRLAHPQACFIPSGILRSVFYNTLSELQLDLMRTSFEALATRIPALKVATVSVKADYWLCIALSHPGASDDELMHLANEFKIPSSMLFQNAALIGRLNMINRLTTPPADALSMIKADEYVAFRKAAEGGHLSVMERLIELAPLEVQNMIKVDEYSAFPQAARCGHLLVIERLMELAPAEVQNMIKAGKYSAFREAALNGHLAIMERLMELAPAEVQNMIESLDFYAFSKASQGGHLAVMARLMELAPDKVQDMIKADNYLAFRWAAEEGHIAVMERLVELAPAEVQNMVAALNYYAFREVAFGGHLAIMERLMELAPDKVQDMIKADDYCAFYEAAFGGHLAIMERLMALAPAEVQNMIKAGNYFAFHQAAHGGHIAIMERLMALAPAKVEYMIKADDYDVFRSASSCGDNAVMERLIALATPEELQNMIKAKDYHAFVGAASRGDVVGMNRLMNLAPAEVQNMIKATDYYAFREAVRRGDIIIMDLLMRLAPTEVQNMIKADEYGAFRIAAANGDTTIMDLLMRLAPDEVQNMIKANDYFAFMNAVGLGNLPVINRLLSFSTQMAHAEAHAYEYRHIITPYIVDKLTLLRNQRNTLETGNPHAVFDIADAEEAKCCFYIVRNLIRRNDAALLDDIRFLLDIPAVKALAHQDVSAGESNELIRLALRTGNEGAAQILLTIPAVRDLAALNNYYRGEARGIMDLGALARDRESSMHSLSTGEQERLAAATTRYQPMMQEAGVGHLFDHLLEELVDRYKANPAKISIDGVDVILPADWDAFTHLDLNNLQREEALKAYYQHKDHTALRYLSCPNPWMAPNASYVYINEAHTQRWSTFAEYKPLIVMLWLAAKDATIAPTDEHTLEGRVSHFIDELAHIGRAHNWDHSRNRMDSRGHAIDEEYDDLAGDKPSCFSGVKRRLFQSVIGHPLLKMLTEEDIHQELRDFVRAHFARVITADNREGFRNALTTYYGSVDLVDAEPLRALNISAEQQALFIQQLTEKYGRQFSGVEIKFKSTIVKAFTLVEDKTNPSDCMHALKFAALANLEQFLPVPEAAVVASVGSPCFFAIPAGQEASAASARMPAAII